jgi:hypothetical protein
LVSVYEFVGGFELISLALPKTDGNEQKYL